MKRISEISDVPTRALAIRFFHFFTSDMLQSGMGSPTKQDLDAWGVDAEGWEQAHAAALSDRLEAEEAARQAEVQSESPIEPAPEYEPETPSPESAAPALPLTVAGRPVAIHNPLDRPVEDLPVVYGVSQGGPRFFISGILISEDGRVFGAHVSSNEFYLPGDLQVLASHVGARHEAIRAAYPEGYRMEFIRHFDAGNHEGLRGALAKNREADNAN